jgi:hypothetical protein
MPPIRAKRIAGDFAMSRGTAARLFLLVAILLATDLIAPNARAGTIRDDVSDQQYTDLAALPEYAAVGKLDTTFGSSSYVGSGTLISSRWILTSASNVYNTTLSPSTASSVNFTVNGTTYTGASWVYNSGWNGNNVSAGADIALVRLSTPVSGVTPAVRYADTAEVGQTATMVGYGLTGTGLTGAVAGTAGTKRAGQNVVDLPDSYFVSYSSNILYTDFDNPHNAADSWLGTATPLDREYATASGDMGGGWFVGSGSNARLAAVTSFNSRRDGTMNSDYGDVSAAVRVYAFNSWIDDTIAVQWNKATGGSAHTAANYAGGLLPDATDIVCFNIAGTYTVNFSGANTYNRILARRGTVTFDLGSATQTVSSPMSGSALVVGRDSGVSATLTLTNGTLSAVDGALASSSGSTGTLVLSGTGTQLNLSGSLYVSGNASAAGGTGTLTVNSGTTVAIANRLELWSSTATVNNNGSITVGQLQMAGGTLTGSGNLTATGASTWSAGSMDGTGKTIVSSGGTLAIDNGSSIVYLYRVLENNGTIAWTGTGYVLGYKPSVTGTINNKAGATFDAQNNTTLAYSSGYPRGTFNNAGLFKKSGGTGTTTVQWNFNNTGTVDVQSGTLALTGPGTHTGTFTVAPGATLQLGTGPNTFSNTALLTGYGTVIFSSGTADCNGTYDVRGGTTFSGGTVTFSGATDLHGAASFAGGTVNFNGPLLGLPSVLSLHGSVYFNHTADLAISDAAIGGNLGGTANVTLVGLTTWTAGTMDVGGKTIVPSGSTLSINNSTLDLWLYRTLENNGTILWNGTRTLYGGSTTVSGTLDDRTGAIFDAQADGTMTRYYQGATFNNAGLFKKSGGTGTTEVQWTFNNTGTVQVQTGTLVLSGPGTHTGVFTVDPGATLQFGSSSYAGANTFGGAASLAGAGLVNFTRGNVTFNGTYDVAGGTTFAGDGTVTFNASTDLHNAVVFAGSTVYFNGPLLGLPSTLSLNGGGVYFNSSADLAFSNATLNGTLGGSANITLTGATTWSAGTMAAGGKTIIPSGSTLTINNASSDVGLYRILDNSGTIVWTTANYSISGATAGTVENRAGAVFDVQGGFQMSSSGTFNNAGLFKKSAGTGTYIQWTFNNTGSVDVQRGLLELSGGGTNSGMMNVGSGATLRFHGQTFALSPSTLTNGGTVSISGATVTLAPGTYAGNFSLDGTLGGTGDAAFSGAFTWSSGTMASGGKTVILDSGTLTISNNDPFSHVYLYRALANYGTVLWTGKGYISSTDANVAGNIDNKAGATFDARADGSLDWTFIYAAPSFNNAGLFKKSGGTGTTYVRWPFSNTGTVEVQSGTLYFAETVPQSSGNTLTAGTWITRANATLFLSSGNVATNRANVTLDGPGSVFTRINTLTNNQGSFTVSGGRAFTTVANLANSGTLTVDGTGSTFAVTGGLSGIGSTIVDHGASLIANSIVQDTLSIGPGASVVILPSNAGDSQAVPEPSVLVILLAGAAALLAFTRRRSRPVPCPRVSCPGFLGLGRRYGRLLEGQPTDRHRQGN